MQLLEEPLSNTISNFTFGNSGKLMASALLDVAETVTQPYCTFLRERTEISKNGNCSWMEVECLGACVSAPMIQINEDYYEDLDEKSTNDILDSLIKDKPLKPGSYRGRKNTAPEKKQIINGENHA